ncbi:MAG: tetratricopeptide repeat protein [Verrucomicrobiota bacterium]
MAALLGVGAIAAIVIRTREPEVPVESSPVRVPAVDLQKTKSAAEGGDPNAQNLLGEIYANGEGVPSDYKEAAKWYRLAAEQGHAGGQKHLADLYDAGQGVSQDGGEAAKWLQLAAAQGHVGAQYSLAVMFASGRGVKLNDAEAVKWYRRAAEQCDSAAQYNLGHRYLYGRGVPQDQIEAYKWLSLSANQGLTDAAEILKSLKSTMKSEQIKEAKRRVAGFVVTKPTNAIR